MLRLLVAAALAACASPLLAAGTPPDPTLYQELRYRLIGPFRGGRTVGATGVPSQPSVFYIGVNDGGVWKSENYGRTWRPIFDGAPTGSVGDVAVSPSHPEVIWVGTGEGLHRPDLSVGLGVFRSDDGGEHWRHVGLSEVQQVARLVVHPTDPDVAYVAALGRPYGPNPERGVYRTRDGGATWEQVLFAGPDVGASQVELDPNDPRTVYAALWEHREGPWENARFSGPGSGLYRSDDGGDTWRRLERGLPGADEGLGRIGVGLAASDPLRLYATVDAAEGAGLYRSDDGGESWRRVSDDHRLWGRGGDFAEVRVHPRNADVVFVGNIASYRSDDGGATWVSIKGAPGGDDYHRIWINPEHPEVMLFAADQGATVTVDGGRTWSSWYNQPTAQLYHVSTDDRFPYNVYGGQQESGAIRISSRGAGGQISFRDWVGVGADEYAYVAPDPLNPDIVYGGRVLRFDTRTGQVQNVAPEVLRPGDYRVLRTMPLLFHPAEPGTLLFAANRLWKTTTGGREWEAISPDLSREHPEVPDSIGRFRTPELETLPRRGVIYAVGASPLEAGTLWAGTDDGLVHVTRDGGEHWRDVTPPELRSWDKVSQVDAGHFDAATAYIAVNAIRRDDMRPHVYRTHDAGATWRRVVDGISGSDPVNVLREDPVQPGLLFAGTQTRVYFSTDDGDHWSPLQLNMPPSSVRDLVVHGNDLVVGTHGRSIWILDDVSPLRELARLPEAEEDAPHLFAPSPALRVRWNTFTDTPLPPEEPAGENPPEGAILDYLLPSPANEVALEILDASGAVVRRYSSADAPEVVDPDSLPHPTYWIGPPARVSTAPGHHRFTWDLRYPPPPGAERRFAISAVEGRTPSEPRGPFVAPGEYRVRLTVDGRQQERPLEVRLDPRATLSDADLRLQTDYSMRAYRAYGRAAALREAVEAALGGASLPPEARAAAQALRGEGAPEPADVLYESIRETPPGEESVVGVQQKLLYLLQVLQSADARPTAAGMRAVDAVSGALPELEARWQRLLAENR